MELTNEEIRKAIATLKKQKPQAFQKPVINIEILNQLGVSKEDAEKAGFYVFG